MILQQFQCNVYKMIQESKMSHTLDERRTKITFKFYNSQDDVNVYIISSLTCECLTELEAQQELDQRKVQRGHMDILQ